MQLPKASLVSVLLLSSARDISFAPSFFMRFHPIGVNGKTNVECGEGSVFGECGGDLLCTFRPNFVVG